MDRGLAQQVLTTDAARDANDLDTVRHALSADGIAELRLVGEANRRGDRVQMARGHLEIARLHRITRQRMQPIKRVAETD